MNEPGPELPPRPPALLIVISGPAGTGKTTLCARLVDSRSNLERVVTATTREPRDGEIDGRDYHFLGDEEFDRRVAGGEFLEWARVHGHDRRYGTLRSAITGKLAGHVDLCMNIDVQGAAQLRAAAAEDPALARRLVTIFLMPPHLDELRRRLRDRSQDDEGEIERRMQTAQAEIAHWPHYDFCLRSRSREDDFATVDAIVRAEKHRVARLAADAPSPGAISRG